MGGLAGLDALFYGLGGGGPFFEFLYLALNLGQLIAFLVEGLYGVVLCHKFIGLRLDPSGKAALTN